jgi:restriction system protein
MGSILFTKVEMLGTLSELIGYKSGLALSREEIYSHLPEYKDFWESSDGDYVRVRSETYQDMTSTILYRLGNIISPRVSTPGITLHHKYKNDPYKHDLLEKVADLFNDMIYRLMDEKSSGDEAIDITPFIIKSGEFYGKDAFRIAKEYSELLILYMQANPWSLFRRIEWRDTKELGELFKSESLETSYGKFFDQRFIDYLYLNFNAINEINWRKFEGLTCEYFNREGFYVEIGCGRDDGNIDARVWPKEEDKHLPPTIIIQCKRQKTKIEKVVVKALWADINAEKAKGGLIVTTSVLSPGAQKVCIARAYPIKQSKRENIRNWVKTMRSPYTGVILAE